MLDGNVRNNGVQWRCDVGVNLCDGVQWRCDAGVNLCDSVQCRCDVGVNLLDGVQCRCDVCLLMHSYVVRKLRGRSKSPYFC